MSSVFRSFHRYVAIVLSFCLIISLVGPSFAEAAPGEAKRTPKKQSLTANIGELPNKLPKEKLELTSKRTDYSTRYLNPDGSFTEEIFSEPQFYQDKQDKKWKKINNELEESKRNTKKFVNKVNTFQAEFSKQTGEGELVSIQKDGKSISLEPVQGQKVTGTVNKNSITYKEVYKKTDIRYFARGGSVKEDIILHEYQGKNTFTFEIKLQGLKVVQQKDGMIVFKNQKEENVWYFEPPFMMDKNGTYSDKVKYNLREENGKTYVDVVADKGFLEDPNTIYPVTIDPTINNWNVIRDNFITTAYPNSYASSFTFMETGYDSFYGTTRSLVKFSLPSLPSDSKITSANFNAYQTNNNSQQASVDLSRITSDWGSMVTWNDQPTIAQTKESTVTSNAFNAYWSWDITQLAVDWYTGVQPNYGMMLKQQNESTSSFRSFNTVNSGNNTPRLTINYVVDPIGLEEFWSVTEEGVNPANGNLFVSDTDVSTSGRGPEASITRSYNSRNSWVTGMFGYGWITNLEARLVDAGKGPITLVDGDNTRHIFGEAIGGGYDTPVGLYLTLEKNQDGTYTISEKDGTKVHFNTSGKISSVVDTNNNTLTLTYNVDGKLTVIKDTSGRSTTIAYGTNGFVSSVTDPANRTTTYSYDTTGNLTKITDPADHSTTLSYDTDHNLTSTTDARSIKTTVKYDTSDRVQSISRPITINGVKETSTTTYSYNPAITSVTDGEGKRVDYSYNPNGNITKVNENPLDAQNNAVTQFCYDDFNNLTKVIDANLYKADTGNTCDATTTKPAYIYTYDKSGNLTGTQLPGTSDNPATPGASVNETYTYDADNNLVEEQDYNKNIDNYDYDNKNNPIESIDPYQQSVSQRYFTNGNLQYITHPMSVTDNQVFNANFEIDENNDNWPDKWTKIMQDGTTATFGWSTTKKFGKKAISISNPTGWAVVSSEKIKYAAGDQYIASGYIKTENTTNTAIIKIEYFDAAGNWLNQTLSYGLKGTHDWTRVQAVLGDVPATTDTIRISVGMNPGSGTAFFDGVQLEKESVLGAYNLVENSSFEQLDSNGKPYLWEGSNLSTNDGLENTEAYVGKYSYKLTGEAQKNKSIKQSIPISGDQNTRLTLSGWSKQVGADPNGGYYSLQVAINYTDGTIDWDYANDFSKTASEWQHVSAEVKPKKAFNSIDVYYYYWNQKGTAWFDTMRLEIGASHTFNTYDTKENYVTNIKNPLDDSVSYQYDEAGNQTAVIDGKKQKTSYGYDSRDLLTKVTDANLSATQYGYDTAGNRTTITDAKNNISKYEYNEFNQVSRIINPLNQAIQLEHNKNGGQTKVTYPNGNTISNTYNALNRLEKILYNGVEKWRYGHDANGNLISVTDGSGKTTTYTYDRNKKVTEKAEGASNKIGYGYDDNGNTTALTATVGANQYTNGFTYNKLDQLISMSRNNSNIVRFVYDERGNVISEKRVNSTYSAYEYDSNNRLHSVINYNASGGIIDKFIYTYDVNSNWTGIATKDGNISYQYDTLNRLTKEILKDGTTITYEYDAVGNRTKKIVTKGTTSTTSYTYDAANQLTNNSGKAQTYDVNGNLTNNGDKTFVYNEENRLIEVKDKNGASVATFTYDDQGRRKSMTTSSGTVHFYYDGDKVIYETDGNNNILTEYTWDQEGNPVTMTKGGKTYYYHLNGHGDVIALTDASGITVAEYSYDAWGNILAQTGTMASSNPYRYASYRYDEATGLYYLKARYYDADTGRFITRDTFHGFEDDPKSLNQYAYAHGNPVRYVDHDGNWVWLVFNAALATYDGYQAYKKYKAQGKSGWKLWSAVAWAVAGNYIKVGKISKYLSLAKQNKTNAARATNILKQESPVWKGFTNVKGRSNRKTSGSGNNKRYYEWDHTHNDIEIYNSKGKHLGSLDPLTGERYKPAVKGRDITL